MLTTVEKTRIIKKTSAKVRAWLDGSLVDVYFAGPSLHGSPAKYFIRNDEQKKVKVIRGKVYQNAEGIVYFLNK